MAFANTEEIYKVFGLTVDKLKQDAPLLKTLGESGSVLVMKVPNLDAIFTLEMKGGLNVTYGPCDIKSDAQTIQNDDIFNKFWQGKLNLMIAMTKGQVKASGAMTKMLKMLPKINPIYKYYVEALKECGREDLVVK